MQPTQPTNNFLRIWLRLYEHTGLPKTYALWTGLWVISSVLQDNVTFREGSSRLKPNLYVWLVGPTSSGKSESANPGIEILREIPLIELFQGRLTALYLLKFMRNAQQKRALNAANLVNPRVSIYSDELAGTLGSGPVADDLMKALTALYGSRTYQYGSSAQDLIDIEEPVINWLACTAPSWMRRAIPRDMLESGFVARMICLYEPLTKRRVTGVDIEGSKKELIAELVRISSLTGEFSISPAAQRIRDQWAESQFQARLKLDEVTQAIYGKEEEHVLKVAMCLVAAGSNDLVITDTAFIHAANNVLDARASSVEILRSIAMTPALELKLFLLDTIDKHGPISHADLRKRVYRRIEDTWQFNKFANALIAEGMVIILRRNNGGPPLYDISGRIPELAEEATT